ncbi:MAG TPA: GTPase HflX [Bacillales bacterium]|nr:GTPase HflX [Bacillales bacterium]
MQNHLDPRRERVLLAGCQLSDETNERFSHSMDELKALTDTAYGETVAEVTQKREKIDPALYIGKGKVGEIARLVDELDVDTVIFNDELSPGQSGNLAAKLGTNVIDRTQLILDIFAGRAQSKEGMLQVELAQLKYLLPRLTGKGTALSRLGGGIGTRGPGETKLEQDRRYIRRRIADIERRLEAIVSHRERYRERRKRNQRFQISLVGYTNAGKSTLFNQLTNADSFEEDRLFATLDPLTRKLPLPSGLTVLISDTVGFIQDLPTTLIAAFRSTLEEVREADLILHVIDASNPDFEQHERTVLSLLKELGAAHIPILTVYNKIDRLEQPFIASPETNAVTLSALEKQDISRLEKEIEGMVKEEMAYYHASIPLSEGKLLAKLETGSLIDQKEVDEAGEFVEVKGFIFPDRPLYAELKPFVPGWEGK